MDVDVGKLLLEPCVMNQQPMEDYWIASILIKKRGFPDFDGFLYWYQWFETICTNGHETISTDNMLQCLLCGVRRGLVHFTRVYAKKIVTLITSSLNPYRPQDSELISQFYLAVVKLNANRIEGDIQFRRMSCDRHHKLLTYQSKVARGTKSNSACSNKRPTTKEFKQFSAQRIANVLTYMDNAQLLSLDLTRFALNPKQELVALTDRFNGISFWLISMLLTAPNDRSRKQIFKKMIQIITKCLERKNFHSAAAVHAVFSDSHISRLKQLYTEKINSRLQKFNDIFDCKLGHKAYRKAYNARQFPKIPKLSIYCSDITRMMEGQSEVFDRENLSVCWDFVTRFKTILKDFIRFNQMNGYSGMEKDTECEQFLSRCLDSKFFITDEIILDRLSHAISPYKGDIRRSLEHLPRHQPSRKERKRRQRKNNRTRKKWKKSRQRNNSSSSRDIIIITDNGKKHKRVRKNSAMIRKNRMISKSTGAIVTRRRQTLGHDTSFMVLNLDKLSSSSSSSDSTTHRSVSEIKQSSRHSPHLSPHSQCSPRSPRVDVIQWSNPDVLRWLRTIGMHRHVQQFQKHSIDGNDLLELTSDELKEMNVVTIHDRKKILRERRVLVTRSFSVE